MPLANSDEVQSPGWLSQKPSDQSGLDQDSPAWLAVKLPLERLFRTVEIYYFSAFILYFCIPPRFSFPFFVQLNI